MLPEDTTVCYRNPILLNAAQAYATSYQWSGFSTYFGENDYTDSVFLVRVEGLYEVAITNECGTVTQQIEVINQDCDCEPFIPNAFTPNNDGYNSTWNIIGITELKNPIIQIFDRYGKLIKVLDQNSNGWNGFYNGKKMPSNSYWFALYFEEPNNTKKVFKGYFSL